MGAVWYRARANLRRRIGGTLLLILAVAVPGGLVMATVAGARQGQEALPDFVEYARSIDTQAFMFVGSLPPAEEAEKVEAIEALPQWDVVGRGRPVVVSVRPDERWVTMVPILVEKGPFLTELERPVVVDGSVDDWVDAEDAVVNESFANEFGLRAGDEFDLRTITPESLPAASVGGLTRDPNGESSTMKVAAVIRRPEDVATAERRASSAFGTDTWFLALTPAFAERFGDRVATYGTGVQGRPRPGQSDALAQAISEIGAPEFEVTQGNEAQVQIDAAGEAIDFESNALLLFALVAGVTTAALVAQALGRQARADLDGDDALRGSGYRRSQRVGVAVVRGGIVAIAGALGAVAVSVALSPRFPVGMAARAELDDGLHVDGLVIALGAAVIVIGVILVVAFVAWRATRTAVATFDTPTRVNTASNVVSRSGAPITAVAGVRMAFERGRGATAVPVFGAALATTVGVAMLCGILVFTRSLDHLVETPELQGWTWDATLANLNDLETVEQVEDTLAANDRVAAYVGYASGELLVEGEGLQVAALGRGRGDAGPVASEGRLPRADDEIALGHQTLDDVDKEIGDTVTVTSAPGQPAIDARVVGTLVLPAGLDELFTLSEGAVMTGEGVAAVAGDEAYIPNTFLVDFADGTTQEQGIASLQEDFPETVGAFQFSDQVENLRQVQRLPRLLALLVGVLALGTLANVLITAVRRRRRDLATFVTLGFRRRQLAATVSWQATTFALLALVLGIPLGVAAGRLVWRAVATTIGLDVDPALPQAWIVLLVLTVLVVANIVALLPARTAAHTRPAEILRSE